jgi:hypothetical protein
MNVPQKWEKANIYKDLGLDRANLKVTNPYY